MERFFPRLRSSSTFPPLVDRRVGLRLVLRLCFGKIRMQLRRPVGRRGAAQSAVVRGGNVTSLRTELRIV